MRQGDWQDFEAVGLLLAFDDSFKRQSQLQFAQLQFDLHLPSAGYTQEKCVGVQQQLHAHPVQNSSGSGASKSGLIQTAPECKPGTRVRTPAEKGTRRAIGVSPSVKMISVPAVTKGKSSFSRGLSFFYLNIFFFLVPFSFFFSSPS